MFRVQHLFVFQKSPIYRIVLFISRLRITAEPKKITDVKRKRKQNGLLFSHFHHHEDDINMKKTLLTTCLIGPDCEPPWYSTGVLYLLCRFSSIWVLTSKSKSSFCDDMDALLWTAANPPLVQKHNYLNLVSSSHQWALTCWLWSVLETRPLTPALTLYFTITLALFFFVCFVFVN